MADVSRSIRTGHAVMVGLPVFLTAIFCFALVFSHSVGQPGSNSRAVSSKNAGKKQTLNAKPKPSAKLRTTAHAGEGSGKSASGKPGLKVTPVSTGTISSSHTNALQSNPSKDLQRAAQSDGSAAKAVVNRVEKTVNDLSKSLIK